MTRDPNPIYVSWMLHYLELNSITLVHQRVGPLEPPVDGEAQITIALNVVGLELYEWLKARPELQSIQPLNGIEFLLDVRYGKMLQNKDALRRTVTLWTSQIPENAPEPPPSAKRRYTYEVETSVRRGYLKPHLENRGKRGLKMIECIRVEESNGICYDLIFEGEMA